MIEIETIVALAPAILLGWLVVRLVLPPMGPRQWFDWIFEISLGTGIGLGLTSCLYFVLVWMGLSGRVAELGIELVAVGAMGWLVTRNRPEKIPGAPGPRFSWIWILRVAAMVSLVLFALDLSESAATNPYGQWDAFGIWNVKARFLASGTSAWRNAVAANTAAGLGGASHPGYPLLVSASVARAWTFTQDFSNAAPEVVSIAFTLAVLGLLAGALGTLRTETLGLLALLVLLATDSFRAQGTFQYADIPLSLYVLSTCALLAIAEKRGWPPGALALAGVCAGLAAWTKNEGAPFLIAALAIALWRCGLRRVLWMAVGTAPVALLLGVFKLFAVVGSEPVLPKTIGETIPKLTDPSRWIQITASFATNFLHLGAPWAHPILLVVILAAMMGVIARSEAVSRLWLALPVIGLLAAEFALYLVTTLDLTWHLSTSNDRLVTQVWPSLLLVAFLVLRAPAAVEQKPEPLKAEQKKKRLQKVAR
jgi:dolichyl-phosphate-mannose-protein mannosyltransferase